MKKRLAALLLCFALLPLFCPGKASAIGSYHVDLASDAYQSDINPFYSIGLGGSSTDGAGGECTWYVWGRVYEKLGITLPGPDVLHSARFWDANLEQQGYRTGETCRANSIMVEHCGDNGHVFFVEKVGDGCAYVTEANYHYSKNEKIGYYHEDRIDLSTMKREGSSLPLKPVTYVYLDPDPTEQEISGGDRYTVLVLDTAGPTTFHIPYDQPILSLGGPATYISKNSIEEVKDSAAQFIHDARYSVEKNYIALVTYDENASVISGFTDDYDKLDSLLNDLKAQESSNNLLAGLESAETLLAEIPNNYAIKNILLCTTGISTDGDYSFANTAPYNESTVASIWEVEETGVKLYAHANCVVLTAKRLKDSGVTIYVVGLFRPVESSLPKSGKDVAEFFRLTAHDIATSDETYYIVEDPKDLEFVFGDLQEEIAGPVTGTAMRRIYNDSTGYAPDAPAEDPDGDDGPILGGHYEDMNWGPALFEISATRMHLQSITDKDSPNYNLAMVSGSLGITACNDAYLVQAYHTLGFKDEDIYLYSYPSSEYNHPEALRDGKRFADDNELAFSIVSKEILIHDELCDLLVITLRGTQFPWEVIKDGTCRADKEFYGYAAWDVVYEFEEDVFAALEHYHSYHSSLGERKLKILVTGHSLGGAGANLVAARLDLEAGKKNWFSQNTTKDDIYAYTFGAIDSIADNNSDLPGHDLFITHTRFDLPIVNDFENIINIYNNLDTFGPEGPGFHGLTAAGNTMYGKFGLFYTFTNDMSKETNPESKWKTHEIAGYIQAVKSGWLTSDVKTERTRVWIRCPVDIDVYKADQLVCKIVSDELFLQAEEIPVSIENGAKTLLLPKDQDYRIVITATDAGTMEYSVLDLDDTGSRPVEYRNIPLESGKKMVSEIMAGSDPGTAELYVLDQKGNKAAKIMRDGSEIKMNNRSALWVIIPGFVFGSLCVAIPAVIIRRKKRRLLAAGVQNEDAQMYCTYCGHLIESGEYCAYCGRKAE